MSVRPAFLSAPPGGLQDPRQNQLLAALPRRDYQRLLPHLELVRLREGAALHGAGERERDVHFPVSGLVCRFLLTSDGAYTGFAVTGSEGMIGVATFLGGESTLSQSVVLCAGHAFRLEADRLQAALDAGGALAQVLMRYTQELIAQTGQVAACARRHSLKQRACFWILACVDRLRSNELPVTHEVIAEIVGVRREGITHAMGQLQRENLIRCHRGGISILDRRGLEAEACECYAASRIARRAAPAIARAVTSEIETECTACRTPSARSITAKVDRQGT